MKTVVRNRDMRALLAVALAVAASTIGSAQLPSSSQTSYVEPSLPAVQAAAITSVGDAVNGYRMVGVPDGLGTFDNGDGTFTLIANHELANTAGTLRDHGAIGAFVSKWVINKQTMAVVSASDLMKELYLWDDGTQASFAAPSGFALNRFCSGDLPASPAFYSPSPRGSLGTRERIYMHGEEGGSTGYQLATVVTGRNAGKSYVLGKFNLSTNGSGLTGVGGWENALASPYPQKKTIVIGNNDGGTGIMTNAVAVYVGTKQVVGNEVQRAGLMNGTLSFVSVADNPVEIVNTTTRATNIKNGTRFALSGTASTTFSRPEDGAWNPLNPNQYYFVTTDQLDQVSDGVGAQIGQSRVWRLTFDDITKPEKGGLIDLLIDGRTVNGEKVNMLDNVAVNPKSGVLVLVEDVGNAAHNGKVWVFDPGTDQLTRVARHDPNRFGDVNVAATAPFNQDEEASGIVDASSVFGAGYYLTSDQAHYPINAANPRGYFNPDELVEGGQLLLLRIPLPVVSTTSQCQRGGWQGAFRSNGSAFSDEGACSRYVTTGQ